MYATAIMMEVIALTASLLTVDFGLDRDPRDNLPYLPEDLCVDFTIFKQAVAPECSEYYIVNPETGSVAPAPLPLVIDYEFAVMTNEVIKRGLILLRKKSSAE